MAKKSKKRVTKPVQEPREAEIIETEVHDSEADSAGINPAIKNIIILVLVLLGLYLLFSFISNQGNQEGQDTTTESESSQVEESEEVAEGSEEADNGGAASEGRSDDTTVSETDESYIYAIGEGESYTSTARRAVTSIDSGLTPAERVAAETRLATDAGAGWLNAGQNLALMKDEVHAAVGWAKSLSNEQKAAWQPYADLVAW